MNILKILIIFTTIIVRAQHYIRGKRNESWLKKRGGVHYEKMWDLWRHIYYAMFYMSILIELIINKFTILHQHTILLLVFVCVQILRSWFVYTLGKFWTINTIKIPKVIILKNGIYKYFTSPLIIIVSMEIILIPIILNAYITAVFFPLLYLIIITVYTPKEGRSIINNI